MPSLRYRSDIDGIRALAVLGVIIYHAFPAVLPGGFTGVDIFFVISGYLISGILYVGNFDGSFRYQEFYSRRIRRLFPALLIVLPLCMAYGWRVMLPREFRILGEHVAAGGLFAQNIVFWRESGYFNESSELNPLLHLWSLAVEEQFYFFFPLIILLLLKRKSLLLPAIIVLIAISFIANLIISISHPSADFYLTPFRVWEFLAGCLLAWCHFIRGDKEGCLYHQEIISWAGFLIIFFSMALLKEQQSYPGWRALLPVAGTLALLNSGKKSETPWINRKILSNPAIVWIGLISYPLYLFHWPALSFLKIITPPSLHPDKWLIWCALGVSLLLSLLTYYGIEKRVRYLNSIKTVPVLMVLFLFETVVGLFIANSRISPNLSQGVFNLAVAQDDCNFFAGLRSQHRDDGFFYVGAEGPQTLLIGDSNMMQYLPRVAEVLSVNHGRERGAIAAVYSGIPPIPGYMRGDEGYRGKSLIPLIEKILISDHRIDRVVLAARWPSYFNESRIHGTFDGISASDPKALETAMQNLGQLIRKIVDSGKQVTVVLTVPYGDELSPRWSFKRNLLGVVELDNQLTKTQFLEKAGRVNDSVRRTAIQSGANIVDPMEFLCKEKFCLKKDQEGFYIRYDANHLRPAFVRKNILYLDSTITP